MAIVSDITNRALRLLRVLDPHEAAEGEDFATALVALNALGARWQSSGLLVGWSVVDNPEDVLPAPVEAEEALAYNLTLKLAPEYGVEVPAVVVDQAAQGMRILWRDRLVAVSPSSRASGDIVLRALRIINGAIPTGLPDTVSLPGGIVALNALGQRWLQSGLIVAWTNSTAIADAIVTPQAADEVLVNALALQLASEYGVKLDIVANTSILWRDRLVPGGVTRTAGDIIYRALRLVTGAENKNLPDNISVQGAINALNAIGQRWLASGLVAAWADVATVGGALTTPASADAILVANLALALSGEYGVVLADDVRASANVAPLWRDRLVATSATDATANGLILRALRLIANGGNLPDSVNFAGALQTLNDMLARWEANGIALGWSPVDSLADVLPVPVEAKEPIAYNLALRLCSEYGLQVGPDVIEIARDGLRLLQRDRAIENPLGWNRRGDHYDIFTDSYI